MAKANFRIIAKPLFKDERPAVFLTDDKEHAISVAEKFAEEFLKVTVADLTTGLVIWTSRGLGRG